MKIILGKISLVFGVFVVLAGLAGGYILYTNEMARLGVVNQVQMFRSRLERVVREYKYPPKYSQDTNTHEKKLPNGLTYLYRRNAQPADTVQVALLVKAGSAYEKPGTYGLAHFLEHMLFEGSESYKAGEMQEKLKMVGVSYGDDFNAMTSFDSNAYYITLPNKKVALDEGFKVIGEIAGKITFPVEEIEKERGVILEEKRQYLGRDDALLNKTLNTLFILSPYKRNVIGEEDDIKKVSRDDFLDFYHSWYQPNNMMLSIIGDIDENEVDRLVEQNFSFLQKNNSEIKEPDFIEPKFEKPRIAYVTHPEITNQAINIICLKDKFSSKNRQGREKQYNALLAMSVLENRYKDILDSRGGGLTDISANIDNDSLRKYAPIHLNVQYGKGDQGEMLDVLYSEYLRMGRLGISEKELEMAKKENLEKFRNMYENRESTTNDIYLMDQAKAFLLDGKILSWEDSLKESEEFGNKLTLDEINKIIKEYFTSENMAVIVELPDQEVPKFDEKKLVDKISEVNRRTLEPWIDLYKDIESYDPKVESGKIVNEEKFEDIDTKLVEFENGFKLILKKANFDQDNNQINLLINGGSHTSLTKKQQVIPEMLVEYLKLGGTNRATYRGLQKERQGKIMDIYDISGYKYAYELIAMSDENNFEYLIKSFRELLFEPAFREDKLEQVRNLVVKKIEDNQKDQDAIIDNKLNDYLFSGNMAYYQPDAEDVKNVTRDDIIEVYNQYFKPSSMQMVVVSTLDEQDVIELVGKYLGSVSTNKKVEIGDLENMTFPKGQNQVVLYEQSENKSKARLVYPGFGFTDPKEIELNIFAKILTSKLNEEIRENESGTYGVYAYSNPLIYLDGGTFEVVFETDPTRTKELIAKTKDIIRNYQNNGINQDELTKVMEPFKKDVEQMKKSNMGWFYYMLYDTDTFHNIKPDFRFNYDEKLFKLSVEDINQAIKKYINVDSDSVEIINYPKKMKE